MSSPIDVINITAKPVKIHNGNGAGYHLFPFFQDVATEQHTDVITITNASAQAGTAFKLTYNAQETVAFVQGTNMTAAAIQTALRALTGGDTGAVVSGTTDTGPFTVVYSDGYKPVGPITVTHGSNVQVITLSTDTGTNGFKLTYNAAEGATSFVRGTNQTAAAIQTALRTATSDTGLLVTGTTDAGPFTVVFSSGFNVLSDLSVTSGTGGLTGVVTHQDVSGTVTDAGAALPRVVSVDLDALSSGGRRDLQLLLSSGSLVVGKTTTLNPKAVVVTNIALGTRARVGGASGAHATKLPARTGVTVDLTALGHNGRRDLINLRAAGIIAFGTAATCSVVNISSKVVRIGAVSIAPKRTSGSYSSSSHTFDLTAITPAQRRDLQHYLAAGQVLTHAA